MTDYWSVEIRRLFWISGAGIALAFLTGYWLPSFLAVSLIYQLDAIQTAAIAALAY